MGSLELQVGELIRLAAVSAGKAELTDVAFIGTGRALAAGTGDNTEVVGATIDRLNRESLVVGVAFSATLTEAENLKLRVQRELSVNGTDWTGAADVYADAIVGVGGAGGSTVTGVVRINQDLSAITQRYVRYNVKPNLSAGSADVATWGAHASLDVLSTAGGSGVAVTGATINRAGFMSGVLGVGFTARLAQAETLSLTVTREQSVDGTVWAAPETVHASSVVATGGTGGSTVSGVLEVDQDFVHAEAKQYVRYNVTPTLSAPATDAASWGAVFVLGSASVLPVV